MGFTHWVLAGLDDSSILAGLITFLDHSTAECRIMSIQSIFSFDSVPTNRNRLTYDWLQVMLCLLANNMET